MNRQRVPRLLDRTWLMRTCQHLCPPVISSGRKDYLRSPSKPLTHINGLAEEKKYKKMKAKPKAAKARKASKPSLEIKDLRPSRNARGGFGKIELKHQYKY